MTDQERAALLDQLRIEQTLRRELAEQETNGKGTDKWWQSKLGLLVIGSLISSLLVPWLQYTQKNFEWKRQNQFENTKYRLERMRECLTEFVALWALTGEAYERARPLGLKSSITEKERVAFEDQFIDLQNRRFRQNAKVTSLMIHFKDSPQLRDRFQEYLVTSGQYFRALEESVRSRASGTGPGAHQRVGDLADDANDQLLLKLDSLYSAIVVQMKEDIGRGEDESAKYRL